MVPIQGCLPVPALHTAVLCFAVLCCPVLCCTVLLCNSVVSSSRSALVEMDGRRPRDVDRPLVNAPSVGVLDLAVPSVP